ncbi:hypothetical protein ACCO45_004719 [Purpureocillium lilacinum]|uniref:Uncharacterized protein n=1 Tax=Purpureocillium lilacinum TaxID=33203 RepID=A0ACC4DTC9_PURLI
MPALFHRRKTGEFEALDRYISTYREDGAKEDDDAASKRRVRRWWQFWKTGAVEPVEVAPKPDNTVPEAWLTTDIHTGISTSDIEERRKMYGWNELTAEKENLFVKFLSYFTGPILYVMEIAALLALGLSDWIDFGVIVAILLLNAFVGFYQEKQAADVIILARELVPGDIILVQEGDTVAADARLVCDYNRPDDFEIYLRLRAEDRLGHHPLVAVDQSAITGESLAVDKYLSDLVYYTTGCKRGKSYAIVVNTAKHSFVGRTAELVQGAEDQGHFKAVMNNIGTTLLILVMFWILAAWIGGFFHNLGVAEPDSQNLLHYALILLIIGVPVGLPVVTTTTLAVGAAYLAKQKAIVQKLTAIESLAGVDILCSDKTGTLTANKLSIRDPYVAEGQDENWMMAVAVLASSHNLKSLDPIDKVTILTLKRYPGAREILQQGWVSEKFTPFDPVSKRITSRTSTRRKPKSSPVAGFAP